MTEPITSVAVHAYYGHLLIELRSNEGCVRMQLMRRDLSDVLTAFVDVVGRLAEFAE